MCHATLAPLLLGLLFLSITMPRIMIEPGYPFRLVPHWTRLLTSNALMPHDCAVKKYSLIKNTDDSEK